MRAYGKRFRYYERVIPPFVIPVYSLARAQLEV
jgi:hypothetical protein